MNLQRYVGLALLLAVAGCKARTSSSVKASTAFANGDIDLTTYKQAGEAEYKVVRQILDSESLCVPPPEIKIKMPPTPYAEYEAQVKGLPELQDPNSPYYNIPIPELVAIRAYTGCGYQSENPALRDAVQDARNRLRPLILATVSGLNKMPDFVGNVARGSDLSAKILEKYVTGKRVTETAFTSSTYRALDAADRSLMIFAAKNSHFIIHSIHGKKIDWLSQRPAENEVLFLPGAEFDVISSDPKQASDAAVLGGAPRQFQEIRSNQVI